MKPELKAYLKRVERQERAITAVWIAGCALALYIAAACIVFQFRHPWATETERFRYLPQALTFQHVLYRQMRPREEANR